MSLKDALYKISVWVSRHMLLIVAVALLAAVIFPLVVQSTYIIRILTVALMYIIIALSLNLLTGFLGVMSLGHAAFWGIGAYTGAILSTRLGWGMGMCMIAAVVVCGMFGLLLGAPVMKLKGYYMTVVTLGFCEIVRLVELNWSDLTRGSLGISGIPAVNFFGIAFKSARGKYYVILAMTVLAVFIIFSIVHSRLGRAIIAIREDDLAAEAMGINVVRYKLMVFMISAVFAGITGVYYAHYMQYIDTSLFTTSMSTNFLVMSIFGGLGNIVGTVIGTAVLTVIPETMRFLSEYRNLFYGILIVVLMMVKPSGILGNVNFKYIRQKASISQKEKEGKE